jgi:hypothetical protein
MPGPAVVNRHDGSSSTRKVAESHRRPPGDEAVVAATSTDHGLTFAAGFLTLGLLLAAVTAGARAVALPVTGGADRLLRVLAALLLLVASVVFALAALGLIGDFSPGEYDPFNCE